jgi:hypothetical protein
MTDIPEVIHGHLLKVPVCITPDYIFRFEETTEGTFAHCDVHRWNRAVQKRLIHSWNSITSNHGGPLYCLNTGRDPKRAKFAQMLGFEWLCPWDNHEIWIWRTNGKPL